MARKEPRRREQQIGTQHHQLAMRKIEHAADPVDENIAAGDERVDRAQYDNVDSKLHEHIRY